MHSAALSYLTFNNIEVQEKEKTVYPFMVYRI